MNLNKEVGRKYSLFYGEIMNYLYGPDDGTIKNKLLSNHPEIDINYAEELAHKGVFLKRLKQLIDINPEEFIDKRIKIEPRLSFDVSDCVINAMSDDKKTICVFIFSENIDEKEALAVAKDFNNNDIGSKIYLVFRSKLFGLTSGLDLFLSDYVSYSSRINKMDNIMLINPSQLIFVLGAGCSIDANIGSWQQLNDALSFELLTSEDNYGLTNYGIKDVNENVLQELSNAFDKNSLIDIAIRKKKNSDDKTSKYFKYVHDILYMNYDESNLDYKTNSLVSISNCIKRIKMKNLITYNFDSTLEKNLNHDYHSCPSEVSSFKSCVLYDDSEIEIFHVHGYIPYDYDGATKVSNFILSDTDFYLNSIDNKGLSNSIQHELLNKYDAIFIGCSFNDDNIKQVLLSLDKNRQNRIYAIMKTPSFEKLLKEKKEKEVKISVLKYKSLLSNYLDYYGIKIIWIKDFNEIPIILDHIKSSDKEIEINVETIIENI